MEKYGKRHIVHYRVPENVYDRLIQVAELFNLQPSQLRQSRALSQLRHAEHTA